MTEKHYTVTHDGKWIKDNHLDKILNIHFNTITSANLCCGLLNDQSEEIFRLAKGCDKLRIHNSRLMQEVAEYSRKAKKLESENTDIKNLAAHNYNETKKIINNYKNEVDQLIKLNKELEREIARLQNKAAFHSQHNDRGFDGIEDWSRGGH